MKSVRRHAPRLVIPTALSLFLAACSDSDIREERVALEHNRALWEAQNLESYRFDQTKSCFCGQEYLLPTRVDVRDGQPVRAEVIEDGSFLPPHLALTVDEVFERIEMAIDSDYEKLEVSYDPEMGYPVSLQTDPGRGSADGGFQVQVSRPLRLDPLEPCQPPANPEPCDCQAIFPTFPYRYTAWDESGELIAEGCAALTVTPREGSDPTEYDITGTRCIAVRCADDTNGPHHGRYNVGGTIDAEGNVYLDFNSGWADNNLHLQASVEYGGAFGYASGSWVVSTFIGSIAHGRFLLDRTIP